MEITWLAHSCFRLRGAEVTVLTDPFPDSIGGRLGTIQPTIVTISHQHPNHNRWQGLVDDFRLIEGPGEYAISGVYIKGIMTPPGREDAPEKRNTAYFMEMDGLSLCHLGDLSSSISSLDVDELTALDILFVPAGGACTFDIGQTGEIIQALNPRIVIPMHYKVPGLTVELADLDPFLREMGVREAEPQPRLNVTTSNLPAETRVVILRPLAIASRAS